MRAYRNMEDDNGTRHRVENPDAGDHAYNESRQYEIDSRTNLGESSASLANARESGIVPRPELHEKQWRYKHFSQPDWYSHPYPTEAETRTRYARALKELARGKVALESSSDGGKTWEKES